MSCQDKIALVTGACGGLGRAIAETFLAEGAKVVVCDISTELIDDFKQKVSSAHPDRTLVLRKDITDETALDELFKEAIEAFGQLDCVVNSAGIMDALDPVADLNMEMWNKVIAVNVSACSRSRSDSTRSFHLLA